MNVTHAQLVIKNLGYLDLRSLIKKRNLLKVKGQGDILNLEMAYSHFFLQTVQDTNNMLFLNCYLRHVVTH